MPLCLRATVLRDGCTAVMQLEGIAVDTDALSTGYSKPRIELTGAPWRRCRPRFGWRWRPSRASGSRRTVLTLVCRARIAPVAVSVAAGSSLTDVDLGDGRLCGEGDRGELGAPETAGAVGIANARSEWLFRRAPQAERSIVGSLARGRRKAEGKYVGDRASRSILRSPRSRAILGLRV